MLVCVSDAKTSQAIPGASVEVNTHTALTDSGGVAEFFLPPGHYNVKAYAPGYKTAWYLPYGVDLGDVALGIGISLTPEAIPPEATEPVFNIGDHAIYIPWIKEVVIENRMWSPIGKWVYTFYDWELWQSSQTTVRESDYEETLQPIATPPEVFPWWIPAVGIGVVFIGAVIGIIARGK